MKQKMFKFFGIGLVVLGIGLIIVFSMIASSFNSHGVFLCEAVGANPSLDMAECPAHTSNIPSLVAFGYVLGAFVIAAGAFLLFFVGNLAKFEVEAVNKTEEKVENKSGLDLSKLLEDEKKVCDLILAAGGSMYQSELISESGFSKVKITRLLDGLEHKIGIIERKRRGMTNLVVLKK